MSQSINWYLSRLQSMTLSEMVLRFQRYFLKISLKTGKIFLSPQPPQLQENDLWSFSDSLRVVQHAIDSEQILKEADKYVDGNYTLLGLDYLETPTDWHFDPELKIRAPISYSLSIDYRDSQLVGNIKNIWEKNRHHHLLIVALAFFLSQDDKYSRHVEHELKTWNRDNPFLIGVNWTSSLEVAIRLISWVWIERLLRGSKEHHKLFSKSGEIWKSIYFHQWFIASYFSFGSSANNHLIGEMAGLYISSSVWPYFPESSKWQKFSKRKLEEEINIQSYPCGLNREQAFDYHVFSLEFFLLAYIESKRCLDDFSPGFQRILTKAVSVIDELIDCAGNTPRFGDSDNGMAIQLRPINSSRIDWLFFISSMLIQDLDLVNYTLPEIPLIASILIPNYACSLLLDKGNGDGYEDVSTSKNLDLNYSHSDDDIVSKAFVDAGLFLLRNNKGKKNEVYCLVDAAPLGFLSIAAHGHADALSFTLNIGGVPIIVDTGTYTYHGSKKWRDYFRSSRAHNTLVVNNLNQSEEGGLFIWKKKATSKLLEWKPTPLGGYISAQHDGYSRAIKGMLHKRSISLSSCDLVVSDELIRAEGCAVDWYLHFSPECNLSLDGKNCIVSWNSGSLEINLDQSLKWSIHYGEDDIGWYSSKFNQKCPVFTLKGSAIASSTMVKSSTFSVVNRLEIKYEN
jgi:hypothetical protein